MTPSASSRRPRFRRHRFGKPVFAVTDRDRQILRVIRDHRLVSSREICALVGGSEQGILRRLGLLFHGGFVDRPRQQLLAGNSVMIYALGAAGVAELQGAGGRQRVSEQNRLLRFPYIQHQLMLSRFHTALVLACRKRKDLLLEHWTQGTDNYDHADAEVEGRLHRVSVFPDAFFTLHLVNEPEGQNRIRAFVEADRSTMTVQRFRDKLHAYWHYWRSGGAVAKFGMKNFRVITVTRSEARLQNLIKAATNVDAGRKRGLGMFLFATEQMAGDPARAIGRCWRTPADSDLHALDE